MKDDKKVLYFAYGSNMSSDRFWPRVPQAKSDGIGLLRNYEFACDKRGTDGSGKGNIHAKDGSSVWGVLYELPVGGLDRLDHIERGYRRITVTIETALGSIVAVTYRSEKLTNEPPFASYLEYIVKGAQAYNLPRDYIEMLERIPTRPERAA